MGSLWDDKKPAPTDGPEFHQELRAWECRTAPKKCMLTCERPMLLAYISELEASNAQMAADLAMPRGPAPLTRDERQLLDAWRDQRGLVGIGTVHRLIAIIDRRFGSNSQAEVG